jgi:hypothetical protein
MKTNIEDIRNRLDDLKKKEAVVGTREEYLAEEKNKLLLEVNNLFESLKATGYFTPEELTSQNLEGVMSKLYKIIEDELKLSELPTL